MNKAQIESGLRLNQLESMLFERLGVETLVIKKCIDVLIENKDLDLNADSRVKKILESNNRNETKVGEAQEILWNTVIESSDLESTLDCNRLFLCASKSSVVRVLNEHFELDEKSLMVDELVNQTLKDTSMSSIHSAVSLFQFVYLLNVVKQSEAKFIGKIFSFYY